MEDIQKSNWGKIKEKLQEDFEKRNKRSGATQDFNALKKICEADNNTVFITFYLSKLWWCRAKDEGWKEKIKEDGISKYREVDGKWNDQNICVEKLLLNRIAGKLTQTQGFKGTSCIVKEIDYLKRLINAKSSKEYALIFNAKEELVSKIEEGIKLLHWKDFEILVDLIFRQAGWRRISVVGETMKYTDLELEEPITGELYQAQIKSKASKKDFENYAKQFKSNEFRKLYFFVHSPDQSLRSLGEGSYNNIELRFAKKLAEMVVDAGLVDWILEKVK